jgi:two-component system NtrC family sensor kinase
MKLKLGQKLILTIGAIIILVMTAIVWWLIFREQKTFLREVRQQARAHIEQILLIRQWISDNGGVYILKQQGVETNPYLKDIYDLEPDITDTMGRTYTLRNPALVTKELSEYAELAGIPIKFRLTSLKPIDPNNTPNEFEHKALLKFEQGQKDMSIFETERGKRIYRYMIPLYVSKPCLKCHAQQGYKVGDIRGGISISIPIQNWEDELLKSKIIFISLATLICLTIVGFLYLLVSRFVSKPLEVLKLTTKNLDQGELDRSDVLKRSGEIESLVLEFKNMAESLKKSYMELEVTSQNLEKTQQHLSHCERLNTIGTVVAGVAHELGNPLNNITLELKNLKDSMPGLYPEKVDTFNFLDNELNRIGQIINQLREVTKPIPSDWEAIDLNMLLKSKLFTIFASELKRKGITVDLNLAEQTPPVLGSKTQITQLIINLIRNAENAMDKGGKLTIALRAGKSEDKISAGMSYAEIRISDTGCGISPDKLPRIFEPFFTTSGAKGSGLGLFISYKIIQEHHGGIEVESQLNKGTTFIIKLPAVGELPQADAL